MSGYTLIIRAQPEADRDVALLRRYRVPAIASPIIKSHALVNDIPELKNFDSLIFTSGHAVFEFFKRINLKEAKTDFLFEKSVFAVGPRTANAARKVGFLKIIEGNVGGQALTSVIRNSILGTRLGVKPLKPLLWPSAEHIGYDMVGALAPFHIPVIRVPVYRMAAEENFSPLARSALNTGSVRAIIAMSERTATIFTHLIEKSSFHTKIGDISLIVSGQKIAKAAGNGWREVFVAQRPHRCRLMAIAVLRYRRDLAEQRNQ